MARNVFFLLSGRIVDFDSYLPIGMEIKRMRSDWHIHFITFSSENFEFIQKNKTLVSGLKKCGQLYYMGATGNVFRRWKRRIQAAISLFRLIAREKGSVLFHGRPYSEGIYRLLYLVNRIRGGKSYILPRSRLVDQGMHQEFRKRFLALREPNTIFARLLNGWADGLLYYHDQQSIYLRGMLAYGPINHLPFLKVGLPNMIPTWRHHIKEQVEEELGNMAAAGLNPYDCYVVMATKLFASATLRRQDSVAVTFEQILRVLRRLRPAATILVRPHPLAINELYLHRTLERLSDANIALTLLHPELLDKLSKRVIINAPTNLIYTSREGRYIDCSDYREEDLAERGNESFGAGYGAVYINPNTPNFEARLAEALDDSHERRSMLNLDKRQSLIRNNPPSVGELLKWLT